MKTDEKEGEIQRDKSDIKIIERNVKILLLLFLDFRKILELILG